MLWAETLAKSGAYGAAVDVVWPVVDARALGREWIARAIDAGGPDSARMLVRLAVLDREAVPLVREKALAILGDYHPAASATRTALVAAIVQGKTALPVFRALARAAVRSLLAAPLRTRHGTKYFIELALTTASDRALAADIPSLEDTGQLPLAVRSSPLRISLPRRGPVAVSAVDAAPLPDGRTLVALGERGARLLSRDGRTIAQFDRPAHRLVVSDRGDRAVLLAPRGRDVYRLARADLARRTSQDWCDARLLAWAPDFDGSTWVVGDDKGYVLVDAVEDEWSALTRVESVDEDLPPRLISRSGQAVSALNAGWGFEALRFDLPGLVLRERRAVKLGDVSLDAAVSPTGRLAFLALKLAEADRSEPTCVLRVFEREKVVSETPWPLRLDGTHVSRGLIMNDQWLAAIDPPNERGIEVALIDTAEHRERLRVSLEGSTRASLCFGLEQLCVSDDQGRIVTIELEVGETRVVDMIP